MPSKSPEQKRFMQAVANSPAFAKKVGVPQSVGKEFEMKDTKKMARGGIFREGMPVPQDIDGGSARPKNDSGSKRKPAAKKAPAKKMAMGGEMKYAEGGKVRGAGMAKKGVKKCQMR